MTTFRSKRKTVKEEDKINDTFDTLLYGDDLETVHDIAFIKEQMKDILKSEGKEKNQ